MLSRAAKIGLGIISGGVALSVLRRPKRRSARAPSSGWRPQGSINGYSYVTHPTGGLKPGELGTPVIMFHGRGGAPEANAAFLLDHLQRRAQVIVPRGKNAGPKWWTARAADADQDALAQQMSWTVEDFAPFLAAVGKAFGQRPIVVGHSQGAMMAAALASAHPSLVREAVGAAGWVPPPLRSSAHAPITLIHADGDATVPYERTLAWAQSDPSIDFRTVPGDHNLAGELLKGWNAAVSSAIG